MPQLSSVERSEDSFAGLSFLRLSVGSGLIDSQASGQFSGIQLPNVPLSSSWFPQELQGPQLQPHQDWGL